MDCRIELVFMPVTDVERAKQFYVEQCGFHLDMEARVSEDVRFVQVTPPTSACSIAFGEGISDMAPGSQRGIQVVVSDIELAHKQLVEGGVDASEIQHLDWGSFTHFSDPDGNAWAVQQLPPH